MRAMKRTVSLLLSLMLVLGMATIGISTASAAGTNTVQVTSNIGSGTSVQITSGTTQVTATYKLQSDLGIVNAQGVITFDNSKLRVASTNTAATFAPNMSGITVNLTKTDGRIPFNFSSYNPADFSTQEVFVTVVFDVISAADSAISLNVSVLTGNTEDEETTSDTDVPIVVGTTVDDTKYTSTCEATAEGGAEELVDMSTFLYAYSSYLAGEVSLTHRFLKRPAGYDTSTLQVRFSGPERLTNENVTIDYTAMDSLNSSLYKHDYHLYSAMFTEPITCEVLQNGKVIARSTYSIEEYVIDKLPTTTNTNLANLYKALLTFGAKAQTQFDYKTDDLANKRLNYAMPTVTASQIVLPAEISSTHPDVSNLGLTYYRGSGEYLAATSLKVRFRVSNTTTFNNTHPYATISGDGFATPQRADFTAVNTAGTQQQITVPSIASPYLDSVYTLTYSNGAVYKTSIMAQIKSNLESDPTNEFYMAVYNYNQAANAYFNM